MLQQGQLSGQLQVYSSAIMSHIPVLVLQQGQLSGQLQVYNSALISCTVLVLQQGQLSGQLQVYSSAIMSHIPVLVLQQGQLSGQLQVYNSALISLYWSCNRASSLPNSRYITQHAYLHTGPVAGPALYPTPGI